MANSFDDVVVVIPGISGSILTKNGTEIWAPKAGAALRALFSGGDSIRSLKLDGDDPELDDLGDGVVATAVVPDLHTLPGLWKIDGYTRLKTRLFELLPLEEGKNYFELPYDWRRYNRVAARQLKRKAEGWLKARRADGHPDAKLVLVCHSMGGIVARIFLEQFDGWRDTKRLVTFGTPYSGSLNGLDSLANGFRIGTRLIGIDLTETLASFTSVYELLPSYRCFAGPKPGDWIYIDDPAAQIPDVDQDRLKEALKFHRDLRASVDAHVANDYEGTGGYEIRPLVGDYQDTRFSARLEGGKVVFSDRRAEGETGGDGTVPQVSAVPHERLQDKHNVVYINEKHGSLQNKDVSIENLASLLVHTEVSDSFFPARRTRLAVEAEDAVLGEPITIRARTDSEGHRLSARIVALADNTETRHELTADPADPMRAILTLEKPPEGDYRVTISGEGVWTVTDLVSVVDLDG